MGERELFNLFHKMPNGKERDKLYKKWKKLYDQTTRGLNHE